MVSKFDAIVQALREGKTTRQIAVELQVSLRDIAQVRQDMNLDIGAKRRELESLHDATIDLANMVVNLKKQRDDLLQEIQALKKEIQALKAEAKKERTAIDLSPIFLKKIYIPQNASEVKDYLESLDDKQLKWLDERISAIYLARLYRQAQSI